MTGNFFEAGEPSKQEPKRVNKQCKVRPSVYTNLTIKQKISVLFFILTIKI